MMKTQRLKQVSSSCSFHCGENIKEASLVGFVSCLYCSSGYYITREIIKSFKYK